MMHNPYTPPGAELEKPVKVMGTIIGAAVVFAAIGVLLRWSWSRWVIYTFVVWSSGILLYLFWGSNRAGYFAPLQPRRSPRAAGFAGAALALSFFAVCAPAAEPSYSVFLGRVLRAETLDVPVGCPEDIVCAWSWVRFKIALTRQLAGPKLSRNVLAVREQHQRPRGNPNEISLFVVVPIEDPDLRKQLKASHKLVEYEPPEYCPKESLGKYGVEKSKYYEAWAHDGGCVSIE